MKRILLSLLITVACIFSSNSQTVTINGGSSKSNFPVDASKNYSYSQFIYLGSEINNSGNINSLTFKLTGSAPTNINTWKNWKVSLAETTNDEFPNAQTDPWLGAKYKPYGGLVEVFNNDVVYDQVSKTIKITFVTPFTYDTSKNLLVEIYEQTAGSTFNTYFDTNNSFSNKRGIAASSTTSKNYTISSDIGIGLTSIPAVDIEIVAATIPSGGSGILEYCEGDNLELTAEDAGTGAVYQWTKPDATIINTKDLTINSLTNSQAGIYTLKVTKDGCSNTTSSEIKVNPLPTLTAAKFEICIGEELQLTGGGTPASSNSFVSSDVSIASVTTTGLVKGIKAGTVNIIYENDKGCTITKQIKINNTPIPVLNNNATANTICAGTSIEFTASGGGEYEFFVNGISKQARSNDNTYTTTVLNNNDKVKVKVWNTAGCFAESSETTIAVKVAPVVTKVEAVNTPLCEGEDVEFLIEGTANAVVTYTINSGTSKTVTLIAGRASVVISGATTTQMIKLSDVSLNGCSASVTNTATVTVTPKPKAIIKRR